MNTEDQWTAACHSYIERNRSIVHGDKIHGASAIFAQGCPACFSRAKGRLRSRITDQAGIFHGTLQSRSDNLEWRLAFRDRVGVGWRVSDVIGRTAAMSSGKVGRVFTYHGPVRRHDEPKDLEDDVAQVTAPILDSTDPAHVLVGILPAGSRSSFGAFLTPCGRKRPG